MSADKPSAEAAPAIPARLAPFLAQWDYMANILLERLADLTDEEYRWKLAPEVVTGRRGLPPTAEPLPPRTIAWSLCHLGATGLLRADHLDGEHRLKGRTSPGPTQRRRASSSCAGATSAGARPSGR